MHWEKISPDLTANPPGESQLGSGDPITRDVTGEEFYSTLYAISESKLEKGVIWTGANDGPFYVSRDDGKTWKNVTPKDLPKGGRVQYIETSPHRKGSAYFAVYRYLLGDYQPYIYKTDDYGATWKRLTDGKNGIPERLADARRARGSRSRGTALRRHRVRHVHLVRQRRALAALRPEHADRADHRHQASSERSDRRDAGPVVLHHGRRDAARRSSRRRRRRAASTLFKPRDAIRARLGGGRGGSAAVAARGARASRNSRSTARRSTTTSRRRRARR